MEPREQVRRVRQALLSGDFAQHLQKAGLLPLTAKGVEVLQINITRRCNLACKHCHVEPSLSSTLDASRETLIKCLEVARTPGITTIDITGGAPEMHPDLHWFLEEAATIGKRLIVRSNLVVLLEEKFRPFIQVYANLGVEVVGSLPDYRKERTDRLRGEGVFDRSIEALRLLNDVGYGMEKYGLILDLVHNPAGAYLPATQVALEREYKTHLFEQYGVKFNHLFCLTNCPVGRYLDYLIRSANLREYMKELEKAFNPSAAENAMCRNTLSVGWDGRLYDCDFNQMLEFVINSGAPGHIADFNLDKLASRHVRIDNHCFSCTAGTGSSCQGTTA